MALRSPFGPAEAGAQPDASPTLGNGLSLRFPPGADAAPDDSPSPEEEGDTPGARSTLNAWGQPFGAGLGLKPPPGYRDPPGATATTAPPDASYAPEAPDSSSPAPGSVPPTPWPGTAPGQVQDKEPGSAQLRPPSPAPWVLGQPVPSSSDDGSQAPRQQAPSPTAPAEPVFPGLRAPNPQGPPPAAQTIPTRRQNSPLTNATLAGHSAQGALEPPPLFSTPAAQNQYADLSRFLQDHQTVGRLIRAHPAAAAQGLHLWQGVINNPAIPEVQRQQTLAGLHQMVMAPNNGLRLNGMAGGGRGDSPSDQATEPDSGNPDRAPSPASGGDVGPDPGEAEAPPASSGETPSPAPPLRPPQTVRAGDYGGSLERIARTQLGANARQADISRYVAQLVEINGLNDLRRIGPNQTLTLPDANTPQPQADGLGHQIYAQDKALGRGGGDGAQSNPATASESRQQVPSSQSGGSSSGLAPTQALGSASATSRSNASNMSVEEDAKGVATFLKDSFGRLARGQARGPNETDLTRDELIEMRNRIGRLLANPFVDADSYRNLSSLAVYLHTLGNQYGLLGPKDMGQEMLHVASGAIANSGGGDIPLRLGVQAIKPSPRLFVKRDSSAPRGDILNLGAGDNPMNGVSNLDKKQLRGVNNLADVNKLPYEDGVINEVNSVNPYEYHPVCKEVARVMRPGAYLYVTGHMSNRYAKPVSEEFARANGFRIVATIPAIEEHVFGVQKSSEGNRLNTGKQITTVYRRLPAD